MRKGTEGERDVVRTFITALKVAYVIYQKIIAAYADANRRRGKRAMTRLIDSIRRGVQARAGGDRPTRSHPVAPPR